MPRSTPDLAPAITDEQIRQRAHQLWLAAGCPEGQDEAHWLQARGELTSQGYAAQPDIGIGDAPEALADLPASLQAQADVTASAARKPAPRGT